MPRNAAPRVRGTAFGSRLDDGGHRRPPAAAHRRPHLRLRYCPLPPLPTAPSQPACKGSNLQALIDALNTPALPHAEIVLVLSNRKAAYGLTRAQQATPPIPTAYLALQPFLKAHPGATRADYDAEVAKRVVQAQPHIVVLAGWMHIMSEAFLDILNGDRPYDGAQRVQRPIPVINLHPALPGAFDGAHAIERAYEAFQKGEIAHSGAMVHRVVREVDRGEPVIVREVEIKPGEPIEAFEERLHKVEWEIIVQGTAKVLDEVAPSSGKREYASVLTAQLTHSAETTQA